MSTNPKLDAMHKQIAPKAKEFAAVLNSPSGQVVMAALERMYLRNPFSPDPLVMAKNCGAYDVVEYLTQMRDYQTKGDTDGSQGTAAR